MQSLFATAQEKESVDNDFHIPLKLPQNIHLIKPEPQKVKLTEMASLSMHHDFDESKVLYLSLSTRSKWIQKVYTKKKKKNQ